MGIVLDRTDYRGLYEVTFPKINGRDNVVEAQLDNFEKMELTKLMGKDLFNAFKANPSNPSFADIYAPLMKHKFYSEGLKSVILPFVYLRYQKSNYDFATENGRVKKQSSTSEIFNPHAKDTIGYNHAVDGWRAIQLWLSENFDDFEGWDKSYLFQ